ncbi:hypothetical protein VTH82DRAFT_2433 [Thermothelomyces myriococcoides]
MRPSAATIYTNGAKKSRDLHSPVWSEHQDLSSSPKSPNHYERPQRWNPPSSAQRGSTVVSPYPSPPSPEGRGCLSPPRLPARTGHFEPTFFTI